MPLSRAPLTLSLGTLALSGALAAGVLGVPPAQAAGSTYVALGDSYSSGTGTRSYLADGTSCLRSVYAYPSLIAAARGWSLDLRACSGAVVADVQALQLGSLGPGTAHVTLSVGGNDAGFADVLTTCAMPSWASNCGGAVDRANAVIDTQLPARLTSLYGAIRSRAPQARVVVAGYPRVFNGTDCNAFTWFSPTEQSRLNATADRLNARLQAAATSAGFGFGNPTQAFLGHAVCGSPEWLNGLSSPVVESYHPNRLGHSSGYAPVVGARLTGAAVAVTAATTARAAASAETLAARVRPYTALDRTVRPKRFVAPDLGSPAVRAAAARAGVDLRSRASIDAADRAHEALQPAAG